MSTTTKDDALRIIQNVNMALVHNDMSSVDIRKLASGRTAVMFVITNAERHGLRAASSLVSMSADWMRKTRILDRARYFTQCPYARNSARRHDAALKRLAAAGEIYKERGLWLWRER
jgi:hypothetical protein